MSFFFLLQNAAFSIRMNVKAAFFLVCLFPGSAGICQFSHTNGTVIEKMPTFKSDVLVPASAAFPTHLNVRIPVTLFDSADRDGDGIVDSLDKCPDEKGVIEYDGCPIPDSDNDGITDDQDDCPTIPGLAKYHGCKPPDKDGDKINDEEDLCPEQPGVARYGGCLTRDTDGDGINDDDDKCPEVKGVAKYAGCPDKKYSNDTSSPRRKKRL